MSDVGTAPRDGVVEDGVGHWSAYLDGRLVACGPDEPTVRAAYQRHIVEAAAKIERETGVNPLAVGCPGDD